MNVNAIRLLMLTAGTLGSAILWGKSFSLDLRAPVAAIDGHARVRAKLATPLPDREEGTLRRVNLGAGAADIGDVAVGDNLSIALFDDVTITLVLKRKMPSPLGGDAFLAEASGYEGVKNAVVLRTADGLTVDIQDYRNKKLYKLVSTAAGVTVLEQEAGGGSCGCDAIEMPDLAETTSRRQIRTKKAAAAKRAESEETYVDILVAYDRNAAAWANANGGGLTNFAQMAVQKMNTALANTELDSNFLFRLVGIVDVAAASDNLEVALYSSKDGNGSWAPIKAKRDEVGADIVTILVDTGTAYGMTGLGLSLKTTQVESFAENAYNVCAIRSVALSHTMTHEVGHNMGAGHSDLQAVDPGPLLYDYSSAFYFTAGETACHTIMAYGDDGRTGTYYMEVPYFSSSAHSYEGVAVGDELHDNTRTLRETFVAVAAFREDKGMGAVEEGGSYTPSTWFTSRETAFDAAAATGQRIFLIYGRDACPMTMATKNTSCEVPDVKAKLAAGYVLWYSNCDTQRDESARYFYEMTEFDSLPGVAVIDLSLPDAYIVRTNGFQSASDLISLLARAEAIPSAPTGVRATDGESTAHVMVAWDVFSGADSYVVWRGTDANSFAVLTNGIAGTSFTDTTAVPGVEYRYAVTAITGERESLRSLDDTGYRRLGIPQITSVTGTVYSATIAWSPVEGAQYYGIYRTAGSSANAREYVGTCNASDGKTEYVDLRISAGTVYYYSVVAAGGQKWDGEQWSLVRLGDESESASYVNGARIEFDANGGIYRSEETFALIYNYGDAVTLLPVPVRDGYRFDGWFTSPAGGVRIDVPYTLDSRVVSLYAHWTEYAYAVKVAVSATVITDTPCWMVGIVTNAADGLLYVTNPASWRIVSGTAASLRDGILSPVAGASGEVTIEGTAEFWGTTYAVRQVVRIVDRNRVTGISMTGRELLDLYDEDSAGYEAWLNCSDGSRYPISPDAWTVAGAGAAGRMSPDGILSFPMETPSVYQVVTARVSAVYYGFRSEMQTVIYGRGYVFVTEFDISQNTVWPEATVTVTPRSVRWWRHGILENVTNDFSDVEFGWELYCNGSGTYSGEGSTFDVPAGAVATNGVCRVSMGARPTRERRYGWMLNTGKMFRFMASCPQMARISFDGNGATNDLPDVECMVGQPYGDVFPTLHRTGYDPVKWYTAREGGLCVNAQSNVPPGNVTLYAHWQGVSYWIAFNPNGASGTMQNQWQQYGTAANLYENRFAKADCTFAGWALSPDGPIVYQDRQRVQDLRDTYGEVTLYAKWTPIVYVTVTLDANGGTVRESTMRIAEGQKIGDLPEPTRDGYYFDGWFTAREGGTLVDKEAPVTGARTFYAHWTKELYWHTTRDAAFAEARRTGRLVFLVCGLDTSSTTKAVREQSCADSEVRGQLVEKCVLWYSDYDSQFDEVRYYTLGLSSITAPLVCVVDPKDTQNYLVRSTGYLSGGDVLALIADIHVSSATLWTVTFDANGGTGGTTWTVASGVAIGTLPAPTRNGYKFDGWFTAANGGTKIGSATKVTGNVTYYAHWTENSSAGMLDTGFAKAQTVDGALYDKDDKLVGTVQVKAGKINAKKGTVKLSATATLIVNGAAKKVTAKAVAVTMDATKCILPVTLTFKVPIGDMTFEMAADGTFTLKNDSYRMAKATIGGALKKGGAQGTFRLEGFDLAVPGELQDQLLPYEETFSFSGAKWSFAKNASVKWAKPKTGAELPEVYDEESGKGLIVDDAGGKTNLSSLKLTYTAKTGQFKGSFKAYALEGAGKATKLKKYTVNVAGFVVDGVGHGEASCKKPAAGPWTVTVE